MEVTMIEVTDIEVGDNHSARNLFLNPYPYFILGPAGAGKSYTVSRLSASGVDTLSVGNECRKRFSAAEFAKSDRPVAPEVTENFVRELVTKKLLDKMPGDTLVIEGFPRTADQVKFLHQVCPSARFVYLDAPITVRIKRMKSRANGNLTELDVARLKTEGESLYFAVNQILDTFGDDVIVTVSQS
jgi:adenylate kinase family enzyme